jgi:hypothetical protein
MGNSRIGSTQWAFDFAAGIDFFSLHPAFFAPESRCHSQAEHLQVSIAKKCDSGLNRTIRSPVRSVASETSEKAAGAATTLM